MTLEWLVSGAALAVAGAALAKARQTARRLDRLTESYWQLRYEQGQLRARLGRLDPEQPSAAGDLPRSGAQTAFVPLSSLKGGRGSL